MWQVQPLGDTGCFISLSTEMSRNSIFLYQIYHSFGFSDIFLEGVLKLKDPLDPLLYPCFIMLSHTTELSAYTF